jgi:hypothetical protein
MTELKFIQNFTQLCEFYGIKSFHFGVESEMNVILMFLDNQNNEWVNDYVDIIGFDSDNNFFIDFEETNCRAYMSELDKNDESCWDDLWDTILNVCPDFASTHKFKVGDKVKWNDPGLNDYPEEDREMVRLNVYTIEEINGTDEDSIILISDGITEAEVTANELELVRPVDIEALQHAYNGYEYACKELADKLTEVVKTSVELYHNLIDIDSLPVMVENSFTGEPQIEEVQFLDYANGKAVVECESGNRYELYQLSDYCIFQIAGSVLEK